MHADRLLRLGCAFVAVLALGISASALESAQFSSPYETPTETGDGSGVSLWSALFMVIVAVLELLGIEMEPPGATPATGPGLGAIAAVLAAGYPAVLVAGLALLVVASGVFTRRHLSRTTVSPSTLLPVDPRWWIAVTDQSGENAEREWPRAEPDDDVAASWIEMTRSVDVNRPHSRTPREWADAAIRSGHEKGYVERVTRAFRERRYGGQWTVSMDPDEPNGDRAKREDCVD